MFGFCIFCISFCHYMQCLVIQSKYKAHLSSFVSKKRSSGICFGNFVSIKFEFKSWANLNQNMVLSRYISLCKTLIAPLSKIHNMLMTQIFMTYICYMIYRQKIVLKRFNSIFKQKGCARTCFQV